jgi:hypothetical protein
MHTAGVSTLIPGAHLAHQKPEICSELRAPIPSHHCQVPHKPKITILWDMTL